jgi:hypothetical protein
MSPEPACDGPGALLRAAEAGEPDAGELEDGLARVFDDWYDRATVRQGPRRAIAAELDQDRLFFPDRLIPYLDHPLVRELPAQARRAVSARHLYQYLEFTAHFEARVVNRAAERIANGRIGMPLKPRTRLDAFKIHCDESYHALFSLDLVQQIEAASGVAALPYRFENVLDRLDAVGPTLLPDEPVLAQLLQLVVFETVVTSILSDVPRDTQVLTVVREVVRDHARDEARHHAFFADFFKLLWLRLDRRQRERAARALPLLIRLSLWPDTAPVHPRSTARWPPPACRAGRSRRCSGTRTRKPGCWPRSATSRGTAYSSSPRSACSTYRAGGTRSSRPGC